MPFLAVPYKSVPFILDVERRHASKEEMTLEAVHCTFFIDCGKHANTSFPVSIQDATDRETGKSVSQGGKSIKKEEMSPLSLIGLPSTRRMCTEEKGQEEGREGGRELYLFRLTVQRRTYPLACHFCFLARGPLLPASHLLISFSQ